MQGVGDKDMVVGLLGEEGQPARGLFWDASIPDVKDWGGATTFRVTGRRVSEHQATDTEVETTLLQMGPAGGGRMLERPQRRRESYDSFTEGACPGTWRYAQLSDVKGAFRGVAPMKEGSGRFSQLLEKATLGGGREGHARRRS